MSASLAGARSGGSARQSRALRSVIITSERFVKEGHMKKLIITTIVIALVSPAVVLAAHKKHKAPAQHSTAQPNLLGRVVHGTHAMRAKVSVRAHGSRHTSHPSVTSAGQFTMHLKPGTYTVWPKRRGAGKGHVAFHIDQGQTMNVTVPI